MGLNISVKNRNNQIGYLKKKSQRTKWKKHDVNSVITK